MLCTNEKGKQTPFSKHWTKCWRIAIWLKGTVSSCLKQMAVANYNAIANSPQSLTPCCLWTFTISGTAANPNKSHTILCVPASTLLYKESLVRPFIMDSWSNDPVITTGIDYIPAVIVDHLYPLASFWLAVVYFTIH